MSNGPLILALDDDELNLSILEEFLEGRYQLRCAKSVDRFIDALEDQRPDMILLDVLMPMMDGRDVAARLQDNPDTKDIPILFISALSPDEEQRSYLRGGGTGYLSKPFTEAQLLAEIEKALRPKG